MDIISPEYFLVGYPEKIACRLAYISDSQKIKAYSFIDKVLSVYH